MKEQWRSHYRCCVCTCKIEQEISVAEGAKTDDIDVAVNGLDALPEDYDARYTVSGQDNDDSVMFTVVNGKMTWTGSPVAGSILED